MRKAILILFALLVGCGGQPPQSQTPPVFELQATPERLDFETVPGGGQVHTATVQNKGTNDVTVSNVTITGDFKTDLRRNSNFDAPFTLKSTESRSFTVTYYPPTPNPSTSSGVLTIISNAPAVTIQLTGVGKLGAGSMFSPNPVVFGTTPVGTNYSQQVTVTNNTAASVRVLCWELQSDRASVPSPFSAAFPFSVGQILAPKEAVIGSISFSPTQPGTYSDDFLVIWDNGSGTIDRRCDPTDGGLHQSASVHLSGDSQGLVVSPNPVSFGTVPVGSTPNQYVTLTNTATFAVRLGCGLWTSNPSSFDAGGLEGSRPYSMYIQSGGKFTMAFSMKTPSPGSASDTFNMYWDNGSGAQTPPCGTNGMNILQIPFSGEVR